MSWRDAAYRVIAAVIATYGRDSPNIRKRISEAYPFGERRYHPYKVWLSEVQAQLGHTSPDKVSGNLFEP